ncbi:MAG TPA: hypothetical protein VGI10_00100 [Polyangiaceae bacterium]|jgi:hypothetical protein
MVKPIFDSALSGITAASNRFDRSAARVTRLAGAPSAAETADSVNISAEARAAGGTLDAVTTPGLEGALGDLRLQKYAFVASLKVLETGDQTSKELGDLVKPK